MMKPATRWPNPPLGGTSGDLRHRILHFHAPIALGCVLVLVLWMSLPFFQAAGHQGAAQTGDVVPTHQGSAQASTHQPPQGSGHQGEPQASSTTPSTDHSGDRAATPGGIQDRLVIGRFTTATGYTALGLLGLTLLIGPANLMLRRRTPISTYLARDAGIWATAVSVIHVIAGFFVHGPQASLGERILFYFVGPDGGLLTNAFGLGNWTGLGATVIVVGLCAISSDFALRKLKARRWKNLQRLNYALFVLVIAHALFYGALLQVASVSTIILGLIVSLVFVGQMIGIRLWRRRHARTPAGLG